MKIRYALSIATRFNLLTAALVLVTALCVGIIATYVQLERQFETRQQHSHVLAMMLAETSEYAVFTGQKKMLEHQLERLRNVKDLAYVIVVDESGHTLAQMYVDQNSPASTKIQSRSQPLNFWQWLNLPLRQNTLEIVKPITSVGFQDEDALFLQTATTNSIIGEVRLAISMNDFIAVVHHAVKLGLLVVMAILVIGIGISLILTARITSPLKRLGAAAHDLIEGRIQPVALVSGGPEIRELGDAFNLMISWLGDYRSEVESYQAMLERQAFYDELTGLANRTLLKEHLLLALNQVQRRHTSVALLFLDLDRFKYVNDTLGHSFGDHLLKEVSQRLRHQVRDADTVARMGGDEFVIILNDLAADKDQASIEAGRVAEQIGQTLTDQPFFLQGHEISTSFSIGIALYPHDGKDSELLIRNADCAMYDAKTRGRNTFRFYEPALQQRGARRLTLENALKRALELNELRLFFQPKYDSANQRLIGAEALLRWQFDGEWISPNEFIPLAEETGQIFPIGKWVLKQAIETLNHWWTQQIVDDQFQMSVNVSPAQFWHPDFVVSTQEIVRQLLPNARGALELELTESCLLRPSEEIQKIFNALRRSGLRFAVDDFGTGYSSLCYLKQFPLDMLKIDQSFVRDCIEDPSDATIIRAIIAMAKGLGLEVIAEGVETLEQATFLNREGCTLLQGYLLAKPMPAEDFELFCRNLSTHPLCAEIFDLPRTAAADGYYLTK